MQEPGQDQRDHDRADERREISQLASGCQKKAGQRRSEDVIPSREEMQHTRTEGMHVPVAGVGHQEGWRQQQGGEGQGLPFFVLFGIEIHDFRTFVGSDPTAGTKVLAIGMFKCGVIS